MGKILKIKKQKLLKQKSKIPDTIASRKRKQRTKIYRVYSNIIFNMTNYLRMNTPKPNRQLT